MRLLLILILTQGAGPILPPQPPPAAPGAPESIRVRLDEAKALLDRRANPEALKILHGLLPLAEADDDEALLFDAVYQTARAYFQLSEYAPALQYSERALGLSRAQGSRAKEAQILRGIGQIHKSQGAYPQSLRASQESITIYEEIGDRPGAARARLGLGAALDLMGEFGRALEAYEQARDVLADIKDSSYDLLLNEIGITQANLGRFEEALESHNRNLERRRERGDQYGQQLALHNLADIHYELGQYERAIEHYEKALAFGQLDKRSAGVTLGALAKAWNAVGDHQRALDYSRQQLLTAREIDAHHVEGWALQRLGDTEGLLGDLGRSREYYGQALDLWRRIGAQADEGLTLAALADLSLREGRVDEARPLAEEALALARQSRAPELEWQAHFLQARVARVSGESDRAVASLRVAIDAIDSIRGRIFTDKGKIGYLDARQAVFGELVDLLTERGAAAQALEVSEDARSRAFRDLLAVRRVEVKPDQAAALAAIRELEGRLRAQEGSKPADETVRAELAQTRAATERDLEIRVRTLSSEEPELASLVVAESVTEEEIRAAARARQSTIVEYLVTESRLFIWVVTPAGDVRSATVPVGRTRLREMAGRLLREMDSVDLAALRDPRPVRAALASLYRLVVAPVAVHLPRDPRALVYIVPHDALLLVPFGALVDTRGRYLVETHTLASAPSIGVLRYTAGKKARALHPRRPRLLALADPRPPDGAGVGALPGARDEVRRIGRHFRTDRLTALVGESASEANGKRLGPGQTILHFAVHGLIDDGRPWDSALILSAGAGEDGFLKVSETFGLDLRADLVVLSGCSTGRGKLSGDGILGLSRAFLYAGTPSVVVSQWDVSDIVTSSLMDHFYAGLVAGRSKAEALRQAQLRTLRRYPHPALWAAFVLIGEAD